jgi:hypothetical protein
MSTNYQAPPYVLSSIAIYLLLVQMFFRTIFSPQISCFSVRDQVSHMKENIEL